MGQYETKSRDLAAYILAKGGQLPAITEKRGKYVYVFDDAEEELRWAYYELQKDPPIGALQLLWAVKELAAHTWRYKEAKQRGK